MKKRAPLVSCIMPTANRRPFVPLAIRQFQAQDYPNSELIILDDGEDAIGDLIPGDPRIRYHRLCLRRSVGAKRNLACEYANGGIIVHWDDDDQMSPSRISYQVRALLREKADLCGVDRILFLGPSPDEAWQYVYPEDESPWVYGGSFCYRKSFWLRNKFEDIDVGEDNEFVWSDVPRKITVLPDNRFYVATIHDANTSPKSTGDARWQRHPVSEVRSAMPDTCASYAALLAQKALPLISCIMPTARRPEFVGRALEHFLKQDYPNRELLVVYETDEDLPFPIPDDRTIRYLPADRHLSIGMKRNIACEAAAGTIIAQWDDDDWYSSGRLSAQAAPILNGSSDITALFNTLFFDMADRTFWECTPLRYQSMFVENVHVGTLVFRRSVWTDLACYPDASLREDADFLTDATSQGARLNRIDGRSLYVYARHHSNSWQFEIGEYGRRDWSIAAFPPASESEFLAVPKPMERNRALLRRIRPIVLRPLASCILLADDKSQWVPETIASFLSQDYPLKELILFDSGHRDLSRLIPEDPSIQYVRVTEAPPGELRDRASRLATGRIISHWTGNAWRASNWLSHQVETLANGDADACALTSTLYLDPQRHIAWKRDENREGRHFAIGAFCHRRSFLELDLLKTFDQTEGELSPETVQFVNITDNGYWQGFAERMDAGTKPPWKRLSQKETRSLEEYITVWEKRAAGLLHLTAAGHR